jgi:hypothetical protein
MTRLPRGSSVSIPPRRTFLVEEPSHPVRHMPSDSAVERFYDDLAGHMNTMPGVRDAATSCEEKPDGGIVFAEEGKSGMNVNRYHAVSPTYLSTLGLPIVDGRDFQPGDRGAETGVVIVDDSAARRLWPGLASPVGRMIKLGARDSKRPWLRVVGVVRSVELNPRSGLDLPAEPSLYVVSARGALFSPRCSPRSASSGSRSARSACMVSSRTP